MITLDVGNSSVGLGVWRGEQVDLRRCASLDAVLEQLGEAGDDELVGAHVAPARWDELARRLRAAGRPEPRRLTGVPLPLADPRLADSAGADRMANALAASPGPAVVVDAGTAVTLDLVDGAGCYLGGFIAPGPRAALAGLAQATAALPALPGEPVAIEPACETVGALSAGAWGLAVGGVDRLVRAALADSRVGAGARLVATGGWGGAWAAASEHDGVRFDEAWIHRGLRRWAARPS